MEEQPAAAPAAEPVAAPAPDAAPAENNDDYVDKGVAAVTKKYGGDPNKTRGIVEKATDKLRAMFEKLTGKKVPPKISN